MRFLLGLLMTICPVLLAGCGVGLQPEYPNRITDAEGQTIVLDDIEAIVNHATLTEAEKRDRLRDLGLEDEELIDALLGL